MIYNTTSPDINRLARDLEVTSLLMYSDRSLPVQVHGLAPPLVLSGDAERGVRRLDTRRRIAGGTGDHRQLGGVVKHECAALKSIPGYTSRQLVFRWQEPESAVYRNFAIAPELDPFRSAWSARDRPHGPKAIVGSVIDSLKFAVTADGQRKLISLLLHRESDAPLNPFDVDIYIRNDVLPFYNDVRYGASFEMRNNP